MVAGAHQHDRILGQARRRQGDRGRRALGFRLDDYRDRRIVLRLSQHMVEMRGSRNDQRRGESLMPFAALQRRLEQRAFLDQRQEGLGHFLAAARPQPCSAPTAQNNRNDGRHVAGSTFCSCEQSGAPIGPPLAADQGPRRGWPGICGEVLSDAGTRTVASHRWRAPDRPRRCVPDGSGSGARQGHR